MTATLERPATTPGQRSRRGTGTRWRAALRLARREALRAKRRSLLIIAMIGIPVLVIAALAVFLRTEYGDASQDARRQLGSADAAVFPQGHHPVRQQPLQTWGEPVGDAADDTPDDIPAEPWTAAEVGSAVGGEVAELRTGTALVGTGSGAIPASVRELDTHRLTAERYEIVAGRTATEPDEVMVSTAVAEAIGIDPAELDADANGSRGARITVVADGESELTVTAIVRDPHDFDGEHLFAPLDALLDGATADAVYLIDTGGADVSWEQVQQLNAQGLVVLSQAVVDDPPALDQGLAPSQPGQSTVIALVVVTIVLEVVLLCGPAFAVGARRARRDHALLLAAGGDARDVRRAVLAQAFVLGGGAAAAGAALGVLVIALGQPVLEQLIRRSMAPLHLPVLELLALVAIGTGAAIIAALVPAVQASRLNIVAALAGRPGQPSRRTAWPVLGLLLSAAGFAVVVTGTSSEIQITLGTVVLVLGTLLLVPSAIGVVGRVGTVLPLPFRLATRDASRNRGRATPAVAAIMGAMAGVTALAIGSASDHAEAQRDYVPRAPHGTLIAALHANGDDGPRRHQVASVTERIESTLPGRSVHPLYVPSTNGPWVTVLSPGDGGTGQPAGATGPTSLATGGFARQPLIGSPDALAAQVGATLGPQQRELLANGGILVARPELIGAAGVPVATYEVDAQAPDDTGDTGNAGNTGDADDPGDTYRDVDTADVAAAALPELGGDQAGGEELFAMTVQTAEQLGLSPVPDRLVVPADGPAITAEQETRIEEFIQGLMPYANVHVERGYTITYAIPFLALAVAGGLIVLIATATATALARADARPDLTTLAAVGGAPRTQRWIAIAQAAVIAGLGVTLGIVVGLAPGIMVTYPLTAHGAGGHILVIPWDLLAVVGLAVPALAVLGAGVISRPRRLLPSSS